MNPEAMNDSSGVNIEAISPDLFLSKEGIWCSPKSMPVSYPDEGNELCFTVEENSFWFKHRNECIKAVILANPLPGNQPIFDIGGGNGFVAQGIQDLGLSVVLVEPGYQGAKNAIKRGINTVICSTLECANIHKSSIPAIGLFDVLEHIESDKEFLNELNQVLQDNGKLYITVPAYRWLWSEEDNEAGHCRRYKTSDLKILLKDSGFDIDYCSYFFSFLPFPILLFRTIPYLLGFSRGESKHKTSKDHISKLGIFSKLLERVLRFELELITRQKEHCFGGSIILVARKVSE